MPPTTGTSEDIIEKRDTSPVATSCLIIAVIATFGAIMLQLSEIGSLKTDDLDKIARGLYAKEVDREVGQYKTKAESAIADSNQKVPDMYIEHINKVIGPAPLPPGGAGDAEDQGTEEAVGAGDEGADAALDVGSEDDSGAGAEDTGGDS